LWSNYKKSISIFGGRSLPMRVLVFGKKSELKLVSHIAVGSSVN
jgi:hypothetical protein